MKKKGEEIRHSNKISEVYSMSSVICHGIVWYGRRLGRAEKSGNRNDG